MFRNDDFSRSAALYKARLFYDYAAFNAHPSLNTTPELLTYTRKCPKYLLAIFSLDCLITKSTRKTKTTETLLD